MEDEVLDILDVEEEEGETSLADIYAFLCKNEDIIITVNASDEETIRRGLSLEKHKQQKQLKAVGAAEDSRILSFQTLGVVAATVPVQIRLQIYLKKRQRVKLHNMIVSDREF